MQPARAIDVEIVVPVYNEARDLPGSIRRLHEYLSIRFPLTWEITIADNASTDDTWSIASGLASELDRVRTVHLDAKGRGRALRTVWEASTATVVAYMDVDLSTDLNALLPLVAPLVSGHSDLAIGTRLDRNARVVRGTKREFISRSYNALLKVTMHNRFSDAQCGFKAARTDVVRTLLPRVEDQEWFFDTELLLAAEQQGLRIHEVPVDWIDDDDSRVDVMSTALADLRGLARVRFHRRLGRGARRAGPITRFFRGRRDDPMWVRPALLSLLLGTGLLYLWNLDRSGWANAFYSAAVQAGSKSWKAFFFGSSDAANFITVDKPPAALWIMDLSARIFGLKAWSILVPQALEGVAAVGLLYATVRRWYSPFAGLLAGAVMAVTPVAVLMFRYNNPDALLVLLLTAAAYAMVRAHEDGRTHWVVIAFALVGTGFITKMMQAFLVVPVFGVVYLLAGPLPLWRRVRQLALGAVALFVAAGWWVAAVQLVPAANRPYVGGSQNNTVVDLVFGYNGFGRITGHEVGSVGGRPGTARWGATGWSRLFLPHWGGQISWLIPAALILLAAGLVITARAPRTDRTRVGFLLWGGWLLVTGLVFSYAGGIIHPYYSVALGPAIGALVGMGTVTVWRARQRWLARVTLGAALAATSLWTYRLLLRSPAFHPSLRGVVLLVGIAAAVAIAFTPRLRSVAAVTFATFGLAAALAGPVAYSLATAATPHDGAIPAAGPVHRRAALGVSGSAGLVNSGRVGGTPSGRVSSTLPSSNGGVAIGPGPGALGGRSNPPRPPVARHVGSGFLTVTRPGPRLVRILKDDDGNYTWVAATVNSNAAAGYQLATGDPVMAIGGFNGTDPAPSLHQFEQYVLEGRIHFYIGGAVHAPRSGPAHATHPRLGINANDAASQISRWVRMEFIRRTVNGRAVYDLTSSTLV